MPYDMETDDDVIELIPGQEIKADHIYINDVDIDALVETITVLDRKVDAINRKLDKIIDSLAVSVYLCLYITMLRIVFVLG